MQAVLSSIPPSMGVAPRAAVLLAVVFGVFLLGAPRLGSAQLTSTPAAIASRVASARYMSIMPGINLLVVDNVTLKGFE